MTERERWIYGVNPVTEAINSGTRIKAIFISKQRQENMEKIIAMAETRDIALKFADKDFFDSRFHKGHQGIAAVIEKKTFLSIDELLNVPCDKAENPLFLILDSIEDPRNFGAILRVADAAGIHGVVFQSHRSAGIDGIVSKASAGASEHVNLAEVVNIKHAIDKMKKANINIIGAEAGAGESLWDIDMSAPLAFVIGSERKGLRRTVREQCDFLVNIPLRGNVNSLNVSVAAGILTYEALRQRNA